MTDKWTNPTRLQQLLITPILVDWGYANGAHELIIHSVSDDGIRLKLNVEIHGYESRFSEKRIIKFRRITI